jgi:uncharacterized protein
MTSLISEIRNKRPGVMQQQPRAFHLLAKPAGAACNLNCAYCFYLSKEQLHRGRKTRMSEELLETYIRQRLSRYDGGDIEIAWQGGEPTLMGLDFFKKSIELVERYRLPKQTVTHAIQTNGLLIDDEWCEFLKANHFLVGLSVDGPREMHDAYRVDRRGAGSFHLVMRAWEALRRHQVEFNVLCTVHAANADHPLEVYRFFRDDLRADFIQFIPIVERTTADLLADADAGWRGRPGGERPLYRQQGDLVTERSVEPEQFGRFLCSVFDEWVSRDVGEVFVQTFDVALGSWMGQHNLCVFAPTCGDALAMERNGDVYCCDHYVEPDYLLGNIADVDLTDLAESNKQRAFGRYKSESLPAYCRRCDVLFACHGECPRNRFISAPDGEPGLNYLCAGYKEFFSHIDQPMRVMAGLIRRGRFADEIMQVNMWEDKKNTGE